MAREDLDLGALNHALSSAQISKDKEPAAPSYYSNEDDAGGVQITCFTEVVNDTTFHFQIMRLPKQIYAWIGCNSAKLGHLYAAAPMRPNSTVGVTSILGGASDNTGSSIARRLVLKTGLNIILACNIPKNSPMFEADAEKLLVQKLISLGYTRPKSEHTSPIIVVKLTLFHAMLSLKQVSIMRRRGGGGCCGG